MYMARRLPVDVEKTLAGPLRQRSLRPSCTYPTRTHDHPCAWRLWTKMMARKCFSHCCTQMRYLCAPTETATPCWRQPVAGVNELACLTARWGMLDTAVKRSSQKRVVSFDEKAELLESLTCTVMHSRQLPVSYTGNSRTHELYTIHITVFSHLKISHDVRRR